MPDQQGYLPNLTFQPYVAPQDDQPVKEFEQGIQTLNQRYDDNIANYDKLDEMMNQIQVRQPDQHIKDSLLSDTRNAINNIATNGNWEDASVPLREVAKRFRNDPSVTMAQQNLAAEQQLDKEKLQASIEERPVVQFKDYKNQPTVNSDGTLNRLDTDGVFEGKLDPYAKMETFLQSVTPDSFSSKEASPVRDDSTGQIYQVGQGASKRYISADKINKIVDNSMPAFMQTKEGQQLLKIHTTSNSENSNPVDDTTAIANIKDQFRRLGYNKTFNDTSYDSTEKLAPQKGTKDPNSGWTLEQDPAIQGKTNTEISSLLDAITKKPRNTGAGSVPGNLGGQPAPTPAPSYAENLIPDNLKDSYKAVYNQIKNNNPDLNGDKDKINSKVRDYFTNIQNSKISNRYRAYDDPKEIEANNKIFQNGNYDTRAIMDPSSGKIYNYDDIAKGKVMGQDDKTPITIDDLQKAKIAGIYHPDNTFYDMSGGKPEWSTPQKIVIGNKSFVLGENAQATHSTDSQINELGSKISQAKRQGGAVKINDNYSVIAQGDGYIPLNKSGKPLTDKPLPLGTIATYLNHQLSQ